MKGAPSRPEGEARAPVGASGAKGFQQGTIHSPEHLIKQFVEVYILCLKL